MLLFKIKFLTLKFCVWTRCRTVRHSCIYENCQLDIAGQCRTIPWPMVPDWHRLLECRCRTAAVVYRKRKKCRCRINFFLAFRHLHIFFSIILTEKHHQQPSVYGRAGCIPFHCHQYGSAWCIHFHCHQYSMDVHGVSFPPPAVWAYMVYPFLLQAEWICRVCPCPPPTSTTSSVDVQGVFISPPAVHAGCTAYSFSPPTMLTCRVYPRPSLAGDPVRYWNASVPDWDTGYQNAVAHLCN